MIEDDLDEMVKLLYTAEDTKAFFTQAKVVAKTIKENAPQMMKKFMMKMKPCIAYWKKRGPKYLPELEKWGKSKVVQRKQAYERNVYIKTKEVKEWMHDGADIIEDFKMAPKNYKEGMMKNGGYYKWASNKWLVDLKDDIEDLIEDTMKVMKTKEYKKLDRMGWATLQHESPNKMWKWMQEDMKVKGFNGLKMKFVKCARKMRAMRKKCPVARKLHAQLRRLGMIIKRAEMNKKVVNPPKWDSDDESEEEELDF